MCYISFDEMKYIGKESITNVKHMRNVCDFAYF